MNLVKQIPIDSDFTDVLFVTSSPSTYSIANGIATFDSPDTSSNAYGYSHFHCEDGAVIEISCEARVDSGEGKIGIEASSSKTVGGNLLDAVTATSTEWKPYSIKQIVPAGRNWCYVNFGNYNPTVGVSHFRNMTIKIYNNTLQPPVIKMGAIEGIDGNWRLMNDIGGFGTAGIKSVSANTTSINISYNEVKGWQRPVCFVQLSDTGLGAGRFATISGISSTGFSIRVYNHDGTQLDPSTFTGSLYIHFMLMTM